MTLTAEFFTGEAGELPQDLFGQDSISLEDRISEIIVALQPTIDAATTDAATADELMQHGVLAKIYRRAAVYYAKRPTSVQLADQGGKTWANPAQVYAALAKQEELAYSSLLGTLGNTQAGSYPSGAVPTKITAP